MSDSSDDQSETEQAVEWLERATGDPMADAVRGRIRIDGVTDAERRPRYQECRIDATAEAPGIPSTPVTLEVVIDRRYWPRVGQTLPARISASRPTVLEVSWDALRARG